jgi:uncharacterized Zn finger protein
MLIRLDANKYPIEDTVKHTPLQEVATVSIAAGGSDTATINIPSNEFWHVHSWSVVKGADVTINSISIDGNDTYEVSDVADVKARYGVMLSAEKNVIIVGTNAGISVETAEIKVNGYKIVF